MWEYRARLSPDPDAVHDGDTVRLLIDLGFSTRADVWIRLDDVRIPELNEPGGPDCRRRAVQWIGDNSPPGRRWPFMVKTEVTRRPEPEQVQSFTRYIGRVYGTQGPTLNDVMRAFIAENPQWGHGKAM